MAVTTLSSLLSTVVSADQVTSGTFADARISASSVTQHSDLTQVALAADAATTATVGNHYHGTIAGYTANRNFTLPACSAGDKLSVTITTGDDTYALILIGAASVSINGGLDATEWSRLFIDNETVYFECFATNDWTVVHDGRIPVCASVTLSANVTTNTAAVYKRIDFDSIDANIGNSYDGTTNYRLTLRRKCDVAVGAAYVPYAQIADQNYAVCSIAKNGTVLRPHGMRNASTSTLIGTVPNAIFRNLVVGDYLDVRFITEETDRGAQESSGNGKGCWVDYQELLT